MVQCPFCGQQAERFLPWGLKVSRLYETRTVGGGYRENARCPGCGSLDRERLVYLYLQRRTPLFGSGARVHRVLHVAPEPNLRLVLAPNPDIEYITADISRHDVAHNFDVERIPFTDGRFDLIICNHVLEHVRDDRRALAELYRVLSPGGIAILQVPIASALNATYEDRLAQTEEARIAAHGQSDHVRLYGTDYPDRLRAVNFEVEAFRWRDDRSRFGGLRNRFALNRAEVLFCARKPDRDVAGKRASLDHCLNIGSRRGRATPPPDASAEELIRRLSAAELCSGVRTSIPESVIRFALASGIPDSLADAAVGNSGATLNKALLAGAGTSVLMMDDLERHVFEEDTRSTAGVAATSAFPPIPPVLYASVRQRAKCRRVVAKEVESATEALLGRRAGNIVSDAVVKNIPVDMEHASAELRKTLAVTEGRIRAVATGMTGSGRTTLTDQPYLRGICTGIDARDIVPPFPPLGNNTGECWVTILKRIDPRGVIAYLPCVVRLQDNLVDPGAADIGLMTLLIVRYAVTRSLLREGVGVFESIGRRLQDLGSLSRADWKETCHDIWLRHAGSVSTHLSSLLEHHRRWPRQWARTVEVQRQALLDSTLSSESCVPRELRARFSPEEASRLFQDYIGQYGELLQWWPEVWARAISVQDASS